MTFALCCTKNWYVHLVTVIYAILKHNKVKKIYLFIEDDNIPYLNYKEIEFININKTKEYITKDSPNYNTKYSKMSYTRCYFTKLLKCDKIVYVDVDTIVTDNIQELWELDLKDNVIAGVHESGDWDKHLGIEGATDTYINSGVLIMDLKKIREQKLDDKMIKLLNNNKYAFPDQDVINIVCKDKIKHISNTYNSCETTGIVDNAKIIHYIREHKGWINASPRSEIWNKYHKEMIGGRNMEKYKIKAIINFDDTQVQDKDGKNVKRVANESEWLCSKERYEFLKSHNAVELIEIIPEETKVEKKIEKEVEVKPIKKTTIKKTTKKVK